MSFRDAHRRALKIAFVCLALAGTFSFVLLQVLPNDLAWLAFASVALMVTPALIVLVIASRSVAGIAIVAAFVATAWMLLTSDTYSLRERVRWAAFAGHYKADVLASTRGPGSELRHAVWDDWGWFAMDTTVYVVFDPHDSLLAASRLESPGKPPGIPCAVHSVHRMEPHWYSVFYFTSQEWKFCGK